MFGALASLALNVIGSLLFEKDPLQIIQVYLTFPLGEQDLELQGGIALAIGCCLYIGTGMLFGIPVHMGLVRYTEQATWGSRLICASLMGIAL